MAFWRAELIKVLARLKELEGGLPGTYQPLDSDLTAIAALSTTAFGRAFLTFADEAAFKAAVNLEAGTDFLSPAAIAAAYQPLDSDLTSWAAVTRAAGFDTFVATPSSANLQALLTDEAGAGSAYFTGGDLGTPSAGVAANLTGLPIATGVSGLGAGVATFLATPTSANLAAALTNEAGTGAVAFQETGTFTPVVAGTTAAGVGTYGFNPASYTKIGRLVFINIALNWTAHTGTGNLIVTGLPFTSIAGYNAVMDVSCSNLTFANTLHAYIPNGTAQITFFTVATGAAETALPMDTAATLHIAGCYQTT